MTSPLRVLELRSVRGTGGGPEKTILFGAAGADRSEFAVTVCYIRDRRDTVFALDERARALGVDYVDVYERHSFDRGIWQTLRELVRDRGIQLVHAHEYKTDLLALMLAEREPIVPLATAHGWTGHSARERHVYYPADRRLLARYPAVIAVSSQIRTALIDAGATPDRVHVVLNAIDPGRFVRVHERTASARRTFGFQDQHRVVGAVGRLEPQKRFDLLIDAFSRLYRADPALRLLIAGDGSLRTELAALAAAHLPRETYVLPGHTDDVAGVHHALDLFVQSSDYEGTSNAVLEAMAFGTPIVATDAGGTSELAHDGVHALIVPAGSAERLTEAIATAFREPAAASARAAAARRRVETELSFATRMQRVETIYRELLTDKARPRRTGLLRWH